MPNFIGPIGRYGSKFEKKACTEFEKKDAKRINEEIKKAKKYWEEEVPDTLTGKDGKKTKLLQWVTGWLELFDHWKGGPK